MKSISRHAKKSLQYYTCTTLMQNLLWWTEMGMSTLPLKDRAMIQEKWLHKAHICHQSNGPILHGPYSISHPKEQWNFPLYFERPSGVQLTQSFCGSGLWVTVRILEHMAFTNLTTPNILISVCVLLIPRTCAILPSGKISEGWIFYSMMLDSWLHVHLSYILRKLVHALRCL